MNVYYLAARYISPTVLLFLISACAHHSRPNAIGETEAAAPALEVIATGANMAGANGIAIGPDGHLYVASVLGSSMTLLNTESGEVVKRYGLEDGVIGPDDVAFSSDGSFYWTSIMTGEVAGFNPAGEKVIAAQLTAGVNPITFSDDDRLFVSQCFFGANLYELDPSGDSQARLIADDLGPGCGLNGMDWGPDGRLYGPRWFNNEVVSFDVDDNSMRVEATGLVTPAAVKFNAAGELHVLDTGTGAVLKISDGELTEIARFTAGLDNFVFDKNGRLFVSSFTDGFVKRRDPNGTVTELQPGGMSHAGGLAYHQGHIIAADLHAIRGYNTDGTEAFVQRNVLGVGKMGGALNIASDGDHLILTSWVDGDVRLWDQTNQQRLWTRAGLAGPVAAVRYNGLIVVAEHGAQRVVGFSESDETLEKEFANGLTAPTGLVVWDGGLFVSDRASGQILKVAQDGQALEKPMVVADKLTTPEGFVMQSSRIVIVEADTGSVTAISTSTGERTVLGRIAAGTQAASSAQPPSQVFNGITADDAGNLYVAGETERTLYRLPANAL